MIFSFEVEKIAGGFYVDEFQYGCPQFSKPHRVNFKKDGFQFHIECAQSVNEFVQNAAQETGLTFRKNMTTNFGFMKQRSGK
jgi:hypothetical protein